jgi:hypothetical protein
VSGTVTHLGLAIELDSDPITGELSTGAGEPRRFCGWIELVAAIEAARISGPATLLEAAGERPSAVLP